MVLKWLGPLGLLAALVIGDQIRINRPGHKYRLTVEVETPAGVKSASSVLAVTPDRGYARGGNTRTSGDAVLVDLDGGKSLVALLAHLDGKLDPRRNQLCRLARLRRGRRQARQLQRHEQADRRRAGEGGVDPDPAGVFRSGQSRQYQAGRARQCGSGARQGLSGCAASRRKSCRTVSGRSISAARSANPSRAASPAAALARRGRCLAAPRR